MPAAAERHRDLLVVAGELRGDHDPVPEPGVGDAVAVAEEPLPGDADPPPRDGPDRRRRGAPRPPSGGPSVAPSSSAASCSSAAAVSGRRRGPGTASDPERAPAANASRRAARSRVGRNVLPGGGAPGRPLPCRQAARRPGWPSRTGCCAGRRRRGRGRCRRQVAPDEARAVDEVARDLEEEAGRDGHEARAAAERAGHGMGQEEALLRPGDPDVGQAALLLDLRRPVRVERPGVGQDALLHAGDEDGPELQALRRVERDEGDPAAGHERVVLSSSWSATRAVSSSSRSSASSGARPS